MIHLVNEVLTFGVITVANMAPVQTVNMNSVVLQYNKPTFAITCNKNKIEKYERKADVFISKDSLLNGGYDN